MAKIRKPPVNPTTEELLDYVAYIANEVQYLSDDVEDLKNGS